MMKRVWQWNVSCIGALVLVLSGCASQQIATDPAKLTAAAPQPSPERAAAVAAIRQKAAGAELAAADSGPETDRAVPAPKRPLKTYGEVNAIEAKLKSIAESAKQASNPAELAALRKRAAELEALRLKPASDADVSTGSVDQ